MEEPKEVTINPKNKYECSLGCRYLRKYSGTANAVWYCELYGSKLLLQFIENEYSIHRHCKCDGTYLFTIEVKEDIGLKAQDDMSTL
jgi:hypothetical protein